MQSGNTEWCPEGGNLNQTIWKQKFNLYMGENGKFKA